MSTAQEASGTVNTMAEANRQSTKQLSRQQTLIFVKYTKLTVTEDLTVFWVASTTTLKAVGSLHYSTERDQAEDQTAGINAAIFTSLVPITPLNEIGTGTLWICDWQTPEGATIQLAFSSRNAYYEQAGLYHYAGFAVYPALQSQLIATASDLPAGPIVSNSLPIFLSAATALPTLVTSQAPAVTLYPSFLVPENIVPPYGVVHIEPGMTKALQAFPRYRWNEKTGSSPYQVPDSQLYQDLVRITLYGLNNTQARQWLSGLIAYSLFTDDFGFMSDPAIADEKRVQPEIAAIAMKKVIQFTASYYSGTADAVLRQLILSASMSFTES